MKTLFPEMDKEIADKKANNRKSRHRAATEYLSINAGYRKFILKRLETESEVVDANMMYEIANLCELGDKAHNQSLLTGLRVMMVAYAMFQIGELKRREWRNHPSGEKCYIYSLK